MLELKDYVNWKTLMIQPRNVAGHTEIMDNLFIDAEILASFIEESYSGYEGYVYKLLDGRIILINDYFGSCSGCDIWESANDEDAKIYINALVNNATILNSIKEAIEYLENQDDYDWKDIKEELINQLKNKKECN